METANFLASIWGVILVFMPLSLLVNPKQIKNLFAKAEDEALTYALSAVSFILGSCTILLNNVWDKDWKTIITIIGWIAIIKGLFGMFLTDKQIKLRNQFIRNKEWLPYALLAGIILGLVCVYFGFVGK